MRSRTETDRHVITRSTENAGPFGLIGPEAHKETIADIRTGNQGSASGRTREEAHERAADRLWSKNNR